MPIDTCGVVDELLTVRGNSSLCVVDASAFSIQLKENIQTLVHAMTEQAAATIAAELHLNSWINEISELTM
jgi:choline dehydrogenase-like flavoprotein